MTHKREEFADVNSPESKRRGALVAQLLLDTVRNTMLEGHRIEMHEGMLGVSALLIRVFWEIANADPTCRKATADECTDFLQHILDEFSERIEALRFISPEDYINPTGDSDERDAS